MRAGAVSAPPRRRPLPWPSPWAPLDPAGTAQRPLGAGDHRTPVWRRCCRTGGEGAPRVGGLHVSPRSGQALPDLPFSRD